MAENNNDAMQAWFARQREERLAELRQINTQLSTNNTSGASGSNSQAVRNLMDRVYKADTDQPAQPAPEPQMQQAILVEVRGLFETRPVTNMLHSPHFRRNLEDIVRASVNAARETSRSRAASVASNGSHQRPQASPASTAASTPQTERRTHQTERRTPAPAPRRTQQPAVHPPPPPPPSILAVPSPQVPQSRPDGVITQAEANLLANLRHEQLVVDISELLHSSLVSSTLNSGFRNHLETMLQANHVDPERSERSLEALRQLPPSHHMRNDFSHLGIPNTNFLAPSEDSEADSVSIISATAAQVPMSHTSVGMAREMASMRTEMQEMRRMLRLVFDMQTDLHRAVRQEVAAAMVAPAATASAMPAVVPSRPTQAAGRCLICLSAKADTMAYRCGHLCMCNMCAANLQHHQRSHQTCPVCRAPIQDLVRVYVCDEASSA